MKSSIPISSGPLIPRMVLIAVSAFILPSSTMCSCACLASCSSSDDESLVTSCCCVVSLSVSTHPEQPTFFASLEISSILLSLSFLSILKEIVTDSIWASIRPNTSSVIGEGDWARMGDCTLDIGAVANRRFIESDESVSSVKSVWYKVQFWFLPTAGVPILSCFPYLMVSDGWLKFCNF